MALKDSELGDHGTLDEGEHQLSLILSLPSLIWFAIVSYSLM